MKVSSGIVVGAGVISICGVLGIATGGLVMIACGVGGAMIGGALGDHLGREGAGHLYDAISL